MEGRFFSAAHLRFLFTATRHSLRVARVAAQFFVLLLLLHFAPQAYADPASTQQAPKYQFQCTNIDAPLPEKSKAPIITCDEVCGKTNTTCVSTGSNTNPHNCDTPTTDTCRCCSVVEGR